MFKKLVLILILLGLPTAPVSAAVWNWDNPGTGEWTTASNWNPAILPGSNYLDEAHINNGGTAAIFGGTNVSAYYVSLGSDPGSTGKLRIFGTGSELLGGGDLFIGAFDRGAMIIFDGGKATLANSVWLGQSEGSYGAMKISGTGSELHSAKGLVTGDYGRGLMILSDGAKATFAGAVSLGHHGTSLAHGSGMIIIDGPGSELTILGTYVNPADSGTTGKLLVGYDGDGILILSNGGKATAQTDVEIGTRPYNFGQSGPVIVGNGSTLSTVTGAVNVGSTAERGILAGTGTVSVAGGTGSVWIGSLGAANKGVISPGDYAGQIGTLNIEGGLVFGGDGSTLQLDYNATSIDRVTLTGAAWICGWGGNLNISLSSLANGGFTSPRTILETGTGFSAYAPSSVNLQLNGLDLTGSRAAGSVTLGVNGNNLQITNLTVTNYANKSMIWTGAVDGVWDISTGNWQDTAATSETRFLDGDQVAFNTSGNTTVTIAGLQKTVAQMAVNNTGSLTIDGNILGDSKLTTLIGKDGSLTKEGTGSLTLPGISRFHGGINLNNGETNITHGGMLDTPSQFYIASDGTSQLNITEGGRVSVGGVTSVGWLAGSHGTVHVDGLGSLLQMGNIFVGYTGTGTMNITDGGQAVNSGIGTVGNLAGGVGTVNVDGGDSRWDIRLVSAGTAMSIGDNGRGTMNITNGGRVSLVNAAAGIHGGAVIGHVTNGAGTVNVDGPGSGWETGNLAVANLGRGTMNISGGGTVYSTGESTIGVYSAGIGEVNVTGPGSQWDITRSLIVGAAGRGTMNITDGGVVRSHGADNGNSFIGTSAAGDGLVYISGAGSLWDNTPDAQYSTPYMIIGYVGRGRVVVTDGGKYESSVPIIVGGPTVTSRGFLDVRAGIIRAYEISGFTGKFNILGAGSDILFSHGFNLNATPLETWFYVDSTPDGTSTINVNSGTVPLSGGTFHVNAYGFAARNSADTFDVFTTSGGASHSGAFTAPQIKTVAAPADTIRVAFKEDDLPVWNLDTEEYYYVPYAQRYDGWVETTGTPLYDIIVRFDMGAGRPTYGLVNILTDYLRNGMEGSNHVLTLTAAGMESGSFYADFYLSCEILLSGEYNVLGWGLDHFNDLNNADVSVLFLRCGAPPVPEPGTYVMLLVGAGFIFYRRLVNR